MFQLNPIPCFKQYSHFTTHSDECPLIFSIRVFPRMNKMWDVTQKDSITIFCTPCEMHSEFLLVLRCIARLWLVYREERVYHKCFPKHHVLIFKNDLWKLMLLTTSTPQNIIFWILKNDLWKLIPRETWLSKEVNYYT